ncbi:hypothetical protein EB796_001471 [Bugula neritina]|uniref:Uncharacterized protein n=1 Tax=Bugula neritina TaxID=10212 RepID=A0A7J7KQ17_BUGNE|nr:hypothetical protein EB796_001471 [Bugula neritina]
MVTDESQPSIGQSEEDRNSGLTKSKSEPNAIQIENRLNSLTSQLNSMEQRLSADITAILRVLQQRNGGLPQSLNIPHVAIDIRDVNT